MSTLADKVRAAGVVGAGGAGFPAHVKTSARAEIVIANGAECEPLLRVDQQMMVACAPELVRGMELVRAAVGAKKAVIALKKKYTQAVEALQTEIASRRSEIELFRMESYYPAGDEQILVAEVTGRLTPESGIPLDVGVVVSNVSSLINICRAEQGQPVTHRVLTVAGEVRTPLTLSVPVGSFVEEVIAAAGGATGKEFAVIDGGPIMGNFSSGVITKTTTGLIVLPRTHKQVLYKKRSTDTDVKKASWACDQCRFCTDYCPRYLLGHRMEPHLIMRLVGQQRWDSIPPEDLARAYLCCQCGVCGMYACPTTLSPDRVIAGLLPVMKRKRVERLTRRSFVPHPFRNGRRIPVSRYASRIDVLKYDGDAPLRQEPLEAGRVKIPFKQHVGAPCRPLVKKGEKVRAGQMIGDVPEGAVGAPIHASISGVVEEIFEDSIYIRS